MHWLEPLVDIDGIGLRSGVGRSGSAILATAMRRRWESIDRTPFLTRQSRLTFARAGKTRPLSLDDYYASDGWLGLAKAREIGAQATIETVLASGLRGRGGAGFPAGIKWKTVASRTIR
jgi:formate dehydrogenase iron-sulfur subunit